MLSLTINSSLVRNDIETIVETHRLFGVKKERFVRIVTGAVPGNRDRPLYGLAKSIQTHMASSVNGEAKLFDLLAGATDYGGEAALPRLSLALLDFLATMCNYQFFTDIERAIAGISATSDPRELAAAAGALASCLHRYRVDHLPYENRRQAFSTIREYFDVAQRGIKLPEDADAIEFWSKLASPASWTTYAATLATLVDYVDAANVRTTAGEISLEAMSEKGFDASEGIFDVVEDEEPDFMGAIAALASAELKLFKGPEIEELKRFASALPALRRWRRAGLAVLCFGPVQNVFVQHKRQSSSVNQNAINAACEKALGYAEKIAVLTAIEMTCRDFGVLYQKNLGGDNRTASELSIIDADTENRIASIMRRKSFAEVERVALSGRIAEILPAVAVVTSRLGRVLGQLRAWPMDSRDAAFQVDRSMFVKTFTRLYCTAGN